MKTTRISKIAAAVVATGGIAASMLAATTGTAQAADQNISKDHAYKCIVKVVHPLLGEVNLGNKNVGVHTEVVLPDAVTQGDTIASRDVNIDIKLPEDLRASTVSLIGGKSAEGGSDNTKIDLVLPGVAEPSQVPILDLYSVQPVDVPQSSGPDGQWTVPAVGTVPDVAVPAAVPDGVAKVLMPKTFLVNAKVFSGAAGTGTVYPSTMDCTITDDSAAYRELASVQVGAPVVVEPVDSVTKVKAPKTAKIGKALAVKVTVKADAVATGKVTIKVGKKTAGTAKVKAGKATVTIPKKVTKKLKGKTTFKVSYSGNDDVNASKTSFKVKFKK